MAELRVQLVTDEAAWDRLAADWDRLLERIDGHTALQTHRFLRSWWRHHGDGMTPWIVTVTRDGHLAGIAPLQRVSRRIWGRRYRVLELLGMPNELDRPTLLVAPGDSAALDALLATIAARSADWDLMQLDEIETASPVITALQRWAARHRWWCRARDFHPCPILEKDGASWQDYLARRSARFRKRLRQARKRLETAGAVSYALADETQSGASVVQADAGTLVAQFFDVERRSWKADKGLAAGEDARYRAFCHELLTDSTAPWQGHAIALRVDGTPIAATFGISMGGVYYSLQIAHDRAWDRYSPGTVLEAFEMEWFFDHPALRRYEFLGGDVFNKRRWTRTAIATSQVFVRQPGVHIALKDLSRFYLRPALKALRRRFVNHSADSFEPFP